MIRSRLQRGDQVVVVIVTLIILAALVLAGLIVF
jgi:hypothetical protein